MNNDDCSLPLKKKTMPFGTITPLQNLFDQGWVLIYESITLKKEDCEKKINFKNLHFFVKQCYIPGTFDA